MEKDLISIIEHGGEIMKKLYDGRYIIRQPNPTNQLIERWESWAMLISLILS